jgi:folylpolyglutamate synthase/dihydropteroate synthase
MQLALEQARQTAPPGVIVVSGSVYLVGEARTLLLAESGRQS